ncbi:MAG TPA: hypothetical protein VGW75_17670 [Solirubrobacteraceae bacterium]|jgi:hypothetical protein|nr:hypothetical protein [Solirubrobacteraceae bacterium]
MKVLLAVALLAAGGLVLLARDQAGDPLGGGGDPEPGAAPPAREQPRREHPRPEKLRRARCPKGVPGCRSVTGPIVYVESVDPDGDGDLHVVVAGGGISLPGITAVDVKPSLRPRRDPRPGDRATAAGPVQTGSYGQAQIHALRFAVQRQRAERP